MSKKYREICNNSILLKELLEKEDHEFEMLENILHRTKIDFTTHREKTNELELCTMNAQKRHTLCQMIDKHSSESLYQEKRNKQNFQEWNDTRKANNKRKLKKMRKLHEKIKS